MTATARMIARRGQSWTLKTWNYGAEDAYNDKALTLGAGSAITAILTETAEARTVMTADGEERTVDAQIIVTTSVSVSDIEDTTKKSPVLVSPTGVEYDALAVGREGEVVGVRRIFLGKRRTST